MNPFPVIWYWRLSIIRCVLYGGIVSWGVFKAGVNGFDGLDEMTPLQKIQLAGDMSVAFGGVLLAFLDNSITKIANIPIDTTKPQAQSQETIKPII